ncbi:hypothetical protein OHW25_04810 [Acinetobacter baumannii]|uniref:hypothetical protein n=1 Tax=Acinetobacter calcoaceticus/baumannii complex TaxID=909768 RepID=UPI001F05B128|nr:hypothetical protein [Acinetobacter pittii]MCH2071453.1 hypothetical protein [Acinetobacter pittii]MDC5007600.1 hypothetical protein [Acinetobacter baumannii]MDC5045249.1 hypothetical protein [Acinetobacter baumannii]
MKKIVVYGLLFSVSMLANALGPINAYDAKLYVGKTATVCGKLVNVKPYKSHLFINLERSYPHQPFYFYIEKSNSQQITQAMNKLGTKVCGTGLVESYKGRVEMQKLSVSELF